MGQYVLLLVVALTVGAVVFGVTVLVSGGDPGLAAAEPDGRAVPLPTTRPLVESDLAAVRFDTAVRGYRMAQVDQALRRAAYDIGYKDELIGVLEAEVTALREGRTSDADVLRRAREAALAGTRAPEPPAEAEGTIDLDAAPAAAAEPTATKPATVEPAAAEAGTAELGTAEPSAVEPSAVEPAGAEASTADAGMGDAPEGDAATTEAATVQAAERR